MVESDGQETTVGGAVSTTVRCWTHVATLPQASVAFQVRLMPGKPGQLLWPAASVKLILTTPPQLSVAVAEPIEAGSVGSPQFTSRSAGQAITGGVVSTKVKCWMHVATLPQTS